MMENIRIGNLKHVMYSAIGALAFNSYALLKLIENPLPEKPPIVLKYESIQKIKPDILNLDKLVEYYYKDSYMPEELVNKVKDVKFSLKENIKEIVDNNEYKTYMLELNNVKKRRDYFTGAGAGLALFLFLSSMYEFGKLILFGTNNKNKR